MMASLVLADPKELFTEHLSSLRAYARKVMLREEELTVTEEYGKSDRMREFLAIGETFKLTEKELVASIYKGLFAVKRGCDCPICRTRQID